MAHSRTVKYPSPLILILLTIAGFVCVLTGDVILQAIGGLLMLTALVLPFFLLPQMAERFSRTRQQASQSSPQQRRSQRTTQSVPSSMDTEHPWSREPADPMSTTLRDQMQQVEKTLQQSMPDTDVLQSYLEANAAIIEEIMKTTPASWDPNVMKEIHDRLSSEAKSVYESSSRANDWEHRTRHVG